jgi:hypothetical protein
VFQLERRCSQVVNESLSVYGSSQGIESTQTEVEMPSSIRGNEQPSSSKVLDRSFHFIVVLWGERFRKYFLEFCLASLLAPGNIPALNTSRRNKLLIATRPEDWEAMSGTEIFREAERYVEPVYIEIPPCPSGRSGCEHMSIGHNAACEMAYREKALALVLTPDCMVSNGSIERLQQLAHDGVQLVVTAALRFGQEPFFENLKSMGIWDEADGEKPRWPLSITGRQMSHAAVNGFHPETLSYEWEAPYIGDIIPAAWWRVPGEDGIVLHCLSWAPMLLDYGAVPDHDTSTLDGWTIDGDYLFKNLGQNAKMHVVQDSDEIFLASWAPMADGAEVFRRRSVFEGPIGQRIHRFVRGNQFRISFYSSTFDPLKRDIFFLPVRWHSRPLNAEWKAVEEKAQRTLLRWVAPPRSDNSPVPALNFRECLIIASWRPLQYLSTLLVYWRLIFRRIGQALRGDRAAISRIAWHIRREMNTLIGRTFDKPQPRPPSTSQFQK